MSADEASIRADERRKCWDLLQGLIQKGPLPGSGCDATAERNGVVLAANALFPPAVAAFVRRLQALSP